MSVKLRNERKYGQRLKDEDNGESRRRRRQCRKEWQGRGKKGAEKKKESKESQKEEDAVFSTCCFMLSLTAQVIQRAVIMNESI